MASAALDTTLPPVARTKQLCTCAEDMAGLQFIKGDEDVNQRSVWRF